MRYIRFGLFAFACFVILGSEQFRVEAQDVEWTTISNPNEEIDFDIPATNLDVLPAKDPEKLDINRHYSKLPESGFDVSTTNDLNKSVFLSYLDFSSRFTKECEKGELGGFKTYQCTFSESGYFHGFKVFVTNHRVYSLYSYEKGTMTSKTKRFFESPALSRQLPGEPTVSVTEFEEIWDIFLSSGKVTIKPDLNEPPKAAAPTSGNATADKAESPSGKGSGIGNASGIGPGPAKIRPAGSGSGTGAKHASGNTEDNRSLQILSKPRPGYTELARYFRISGTTRLRVTFNANNTIGSVTPITRLPFGLTRHAIFAARGMIFNPEIRRGRSVGVKKTVAYNFTIY